MTVSSPSFRLRPSFPLEKRKRHGFVGERDAARAWSCAVSFSYLW